MNPQAVPRAPSARTRRAPRSRIPNPLALLCICALALLLLSCTTQGSKVYQKYQGTEGLTIAFLKNAPPETVYEDRPFPVKFEVHNKGADNVTYDKLIVVFSTNPLYITNISGGISPYRPGLYDDSLKKVIEGRSEMFPQGEKRLYSIPTDASFYARPVYGQRERPETEMTVSACYVYHTYAAAEVCIDTNLYEENQRVQSCKSKDVTLSGGQGAPIAVTKVEVDALPVLSGEGPDRTQSIRPQFTIYLENVGKGYLIGPDTLDLEKACVLKNVSKDEVGTVRLTATLFKARLLCGAGVKRGQSYEALVRLEGGKGEVICTVADDELGNGIYSSTQNFQSVVTINLSYIYKVNANKMIAIERIPGSIVPAPSTDGKTQTPGYAYTAAGELRKDDTGKPYTLCEYYQDQYAEHPEDVPEPLKSAIPRLKPVGFSCSCNRERCLTLARNSESCYIGTAFCPGDTFCCAEPAKVTSGTGAGMGGGDTGSGSETPTTLPQVYGEGDKLVAAPGATQKVKATVANINKYNLYPTIKAAATKYNVPESALLATFTLESSGSPTAKNTAGGGAGALGIAQFRGPAAYTYGLCDNANCYPGKDLRSDPAYAIPAAAHYLSDLYKQVAGYASNDNDRYLLAVASYFKGFGCVQEAYAIAQKNAGGTPTATQTLGAIPSVTKYSSCRAGETALAYVQKWDSFENQYATG